MTVALCTDAHQQRVRVVARGVVLDADGAQCAAHVLARRWRHPCRLLDLAHFGGHVAGSQALHNDAVLLVLRCQVSAEFGDEHLRNKIDENC